MDLSANDIILKYYGPKEDQIKKIFSRLCKKRPDLLFSYIDVADKSDFENPINTTIVTDQFVNADRYPSKQILKLPDSLYGIYYIPDPLVERSISKDFNLFINRANVHRQFWFYKMIVNNWLCQSTTSYIGSTARSTHPDLDARQFVDYLHEKFFYPYYDDAYRFAREHVPYQNFVESGDLRESMTETKLSIVIETYHERTDAVTFSEKIFRALQVPRPWVLSGATGSVSILRSMGFDVFDDYIDHSYDEYDTSENMIQRDCAIFNEIAKFAKLEITQSILKDWRIRYQKNLSILEHWYHSWNRDLDIFISKYFEETETKQ